MTTEELTILIVLLGTVAISLLTAWLVRRAKPESRIFWFLGSLFIMLLLFGLKWTLFPLAIHLTILTVWKKDNTAPILNVLHGLLNGLMVALSFALYGIYLILIFGTLFWLYTAVKIGSFLMFVLGIFLPPLSALVGGYALLFGFPEWVFRWFG